MWRSDTSPVEVALREAEEEIGLIRRQVEVIGTLPEYFTRNGYRVTAVVCLLADVPDRWPESPIT
jgi:8-oxo-dGTP pyrophosphatase MutT (NUDIX family)